MFGASINAKNFTLCIVIYISLVSLCFVEIHCFQQETLTCWRWLCGEYQNLFWLDFLKNIKIVQSINMLLLTLNSAMTKELLGNMCGIIYVVKQKIAIIVILNGGKFNTLTTYLLIYHDIYILRILVKRERKWNEFNIVNASNLFEKNEDWNPCLFKWNITINWRK